MHMSLRDSDESTPSDFGVKGVVVRTWTERSDTRGSSVPGVPGPSDRTQCRCLWSGLSVLTFGHSSGVRSPVFGELGGDGAIGLVSDFFVSRPFTPKFPVWYEFLVGSVSNYRV